MFKKILAVLTAAVLFTSCGITDAVNKKINKAKEKANEKLIESGEKFSDKMKDIYGESSLDKGKRIAKEVGQNVLTDILNKDADALADMFCQYTVDGYGDRDYLKTEVQNLFDYFDGEIVSHDEIETRASVGKSREEYGPVIFYYHALIYNVITDTNNNYTISCRGYMIYKDHPELEGFVQLHVTNTNNSEQYQIGNLPEEDLV